MLICPSLIQKWKTFEYRRWIYSLCCYNSKDYDVCANYIDKKLISIPIELFEIIDSRVSKYWSISYSDSTTRFWPNEFYQEYFPDDLFEEVTEVISHFNEVKNKLEIEFS